MSTIQSQVAWWYCKWNQQELGGHNVNQTLRMYSYKLYPPIAIIASPLSQGHHLWQRFYSIHISDDGVIISSTLFLYFQRGEGCVYASLQWRHNGPDGVSNHQPRACLLNRLFWHRSKRNQSSASLAFVRGIHRWPVNSPHKGPVTRKMFPFDDVIMLTHYVWCHNMETLSTLLVFYAKNRTICGGFHSQRTNNAGL